MPLSQPLAGKIEPNTPSWHAATSRDRLAFYREAGVVLVRLKRQELERGIGAEGRMAPVKRRWGYRKPLVPHFHNSRTYRLVAARHTDHSVTLYWHAGAGVRTRAGDRLSWGDILEAHAAGHVFGGVVRDPRLSPAGITRARRELSRWWANYIRAQTRARRALPAGATRRGRVVELPPGVRPNPLSRLIQLFSSN